MNGYYVPRWQIFVDYLMEVPITRYNVTELDARLMDFELGWQTQGMNAAMMQTFEGRVESLKSVLGDTVISWSEIFGH